MPKVSLRELLIQAELNDKSEVLGAKKNPVVSDLQHDSRKVSEGTLYIAIKGANSDGHQFIADAIRRGASAVLIEKGSREALGELSQRVPVVAVEDVRLALAYLASAFFGRPSDKLLCMGVTGTNGKTSVAWILASILGQLGYPSALIGTLGKGILSKNCAAAIPSFESTANTTPDPLEIQEFLSACAAENAKAAVLEATSQGHVQHRTAAMQWDSMVFTNLSRDHLDLHGTLENYEAIKCSLFTEALVQSSKQKKTAVTNIDDPVGVRIGEALSSSTNIELLSFSTKNAKADVYGTEISGDIKRSRIKAELRGKKVEFNSKLIGAYNVSNIIASLAALESLGFDVGEVSDALSKVLPVPGRLEVVGDADIHVVVDYAHTPDALIKAQESLRSLCPKRLITVFGCGGDRDRGKRPLMGEAVAELSDYAVVTSDNPRTENPDRIIEDIIPGIDGARARQGFKYRSIVLREEAIAHAISEAESGDVVLVAGKGHEDYQDICGIKHPFLDSDVCLGVMKDKGIL